MLLTLRIVLVTIFFSLSGSLSAQRQYSAHSVLATGNWFRIAIPHHGIYKLDAAFLKQAGISLPFPSALLRIFGKAGGQPAEACALPYADDLHELAIAREDGGDGIFNDGDRFIFYAEGATGWKRDPANKRFTAVHNLYSDSTYLYVTVGGVGKTVETGGASAPVTHQVDHYQYRFYYEKDAFNLLSSGKEWYGERFLAGDGTTIAIDPAIPQLAPGGAATLVSSVAARSVGSPSTFDIEYGGAQVLEHSIAAVGSSGLDLFARDDIRETDFIPGGTSALTYSFQSSNASAMGWLNNVTVIADCRLQYTGQQLGFRTWTGAATGRVAKYQLTGGTGGMQVWRVTEPFGPVKMALTLNGGEAVFTDAHENAEEYIAFEDAMTPVFKGAVPNQDLHGAAIPQMVIVTYPGLSAAANRLASWHRQHDGISSLVVNAEQVFNEFSGGQSNPVAIRDFMKMLYDRAGGNSENAPRYLLLLGDASYDFKYRIPGNNNKVPTYQGSYSLDPLATYASDDFFGFLDDHEDINSGLVTNLLDIGIGRIPVETETVANDYIDKVIMYHDPSARGAWRNDLTFIADDEDFNLHVQDAEELVSRSLAENNRFLADKIYLDAFRQSGDAAGARYPAVNQAISDRMQHGTLIWNYSGHGSYRRLAEEVVLEQPIVDAWDQKGRLPLFVTATCDFAPYDNPAISSLGEYLLVKPRAGAIALMTTTRLVFSFSNRIMNGNYLEAALQRLPEGRYRTLGEAVMVAKNITYQRSGDVFNNLKFTLLGDPALTLAFPRYDVVTTYINDKAVSSTADTVNALQKITIKGMVTDGNGQPKPGFNGTVFPLVMDQSYEKQTLANDATSVQQDFAAQDRYLFKGKATVKNGFFSFSFVVPKDVTYTAGRMRISYYAMDSLTDAHGAYDRLVVAGSDVPPADREGPQINAWLNDSSFHDGGLSSETPALLLRLQDTSGINILGNGIGHDITVMIDEDPSHIYILNGFFEADTDTYRSGSLVFRLPELKEGKHKMRIKAWDVLNNSNEYDLNFMVRSRNNLVLGESRVWPNPSAGPVRFMIEHNNDGSFLDTEIQLFSMNGSFVKTLKGTIIAYGNRSYMDWNGKDNRGNPVSPGIYVYRIIVRTADGRQAIAVKKLVRL